MEAKKVRPGKILLMIALSLSTIALMSDMVIIPIADSLYSNYSGVGIVNFILSGPALISAVVSAFAGKIIEKIGAKKFIIAGFGIFTAASVLIIFVNDEIITAICRVLQGIGMGTCSVVAMVLIAGHFVSEKVRSSMMGIYNGMMALMGAVLGMVSGIVAGSGWHNVFYIYLVSIPVFLCIILFIPADAHAESEAEEVKTGTGPSARMPWGIVIRTAVGFFVYNVIYCVIYYQISVIMAEKGIKDVAVIGAMSSLGTVGSFIACSLFGIYFGRLKRFTITLGFILQIAFFAVIYMTSSAAAGCIACVFLGAAYGLGITYYMTYATMIVPKEHVPMSSSIVVFAMGISTFLASYLPYGLQAVLGVDTIGAIIPVLIAVLGAGAVLSIFFGIKERSCCNM